MSDYSEAAERFESAIVDMVGIDYAGTLSLVTGVFVGLALEVLRRNGHNPEGEVRIDGGESRDVTIHAAKSAPAASQGGA